MPHLTMPRSQRNMRVSSGASVWHSAIRSALVLALILLFVPSLASGQSKLPSKPQGYVNDFANVLSPAAHAQLEALCTEVNEKGKAQIFVVTVTSLDGRSVEDYSFDLATKWGVGPKDTSSGVLILLSIGDRKYWTQVGYGLESILPDGKVGGFGREAVPYLRDKNYDAAVTLLTRRVADVIAQDRGITLSNAPSFARHSSGRENNGLSTGATFFLLIFILLFIARMIKRGSQMGRRGGGGSGWWIGPMIGGGMGSGGWGGGGFWRWRRIWGWFWWRRWWFVWRRWGRRKLVISRSVSAYSKYRRMSDGSQARRTRETVSVRRLKVI